MIYSNCRKTLTFRDLPLCSLLSWEFQKNSLPCIQYCVPGRYGNASFWPTVYTEPFSYPASNECSCIGNYFSVYAMPFSYGNISIPFSYDNDIVYTGPNNETWFTANKTELRRSAIVRCNRCGCGCLLGYLHSTEFRLALLELKSQRNDFWNVWRGDTSSWQVIVLEIYLLACCQVANYDMLATVKYHCAFRCSI